ncbi:MAG: hypothetical protein NE328_11060 [Lentisphaeraceae bacterium]|nr:hypothetical protein [Lentisphaeraceae bacterium]
MKNILILLILAFTSTLTFAQTEDGDKDKDKRFKRDGDFKGDRKFDRMKFFLEKFKKENPEKFKELEALKESDPEAFRSQIRELIQKKMTEHMMNNEGKGDRHWLHDMKEKNPEKYDELMKLRETDPEAFRQKMVQEFSQRFKRRGDHDENTRNEIRVILSKYNEASSEEEKAELKQALRAKLEESFDKDQKKRMEMAEKIEAHLNEVKTQIKERESKKSSYIDKKVEYLIQGKFRRGDDCDKDQKKDVKRD